MKSSTHVLYILLVLCLSLVNKSRLLQKPPKLKQNQGVWFPNDISCQFDIIWSCLLDHLPCSMGKYGEAWPWFTKISLLQGAARSLPVMPWYLPVHPISIVKWFDEILQGSSRFFTCHFHPRYWKHTSYIFYPPIWWPFLPHRYLSELATLPTSFVSGSGLSRLTPSHGFDDLDVIPSNLRWQGKKTQPIFRECPRHI